MLEFDDIQHFLIARPPARAARYEFLTFRQPAGGQAWMKGIIEKVGTAKTVGAGEPDSRWVTVAFTWQGLRTLGVDEASLASFPEEFRNLRRFPEQRREILQSQQWRLFASLWNSTCPWRVVGNRKQP